MVIKPNSLVLGDALNLLERLENSSVDLIYLDPPFSLPNIDDEGQARDDYFDFIHKVLQQAYRVLKDTGSVFVFSNYEYGVDFHLLLRKVFGSMNRKPDFIIPRRSQSQTGKIVSAYDTMIVYGKPSFIPVTRIKLLDKKEISQLFPFSENGNLYRVVSLFTRYVNQPKSNFSWHGHVPPKGRSWRYPIDRLEYLSKENYIRNIEDTPVLKQFADEDDFLSDIGTIWDDLVDFSKRELDTQQPIKLLERVLGISTKPDEVVVDPFCGSGTMPVACLQMRRQFIASDSSGEAFEISMERIERTSSKAPSTSFIDDTQLEEFPVLWDNYLAASPTEESVIIQLIESDEGGVTEFKESLAWNYNIHSKLEKNTDLLKAMAAFMNTEGGTVIIGVRNDKSLIDLTKDYQTVNAQKGDRDGYALFINEKVSSKLRPVPISGYNIKFFIINGCEICVINVKKLENPTFVEGVFYVRNGNQSIPFDNERFYDYLGSHFAQ